MAGKDITMTGKDGTFGGYLATPASDKGPGVVIIQEIFGVNPWVRGVADWPRRHAGSDQDGSVRLRRQGPAQGHVAG